MSKASCQRCGHSEHGSYYHACATCGNASGENCIMTMFTATEITKKLGNGVPKALLMGEGDEGSTVEWGTPDYIFDGADAEFGPFTLDPASALGYHTSNVILARGGTICVAPGSDHSVYQTPGVYWPERDDDPLGGLGLEWTGRVWLNHPYGRLDWRWMKKAHDSVRYGDAEIVIALIPVKPQMKWWHKYVGGTEIRRVRTPYTVPSIRVFGNTQDNDSWTEPETRYVESWDSRSPLYPNARGADLRREIRGRLRFKGAPSSAPFASALVGWWK